MGKRTGSLTPAKIADQRAIVDRRALAATIADLVEDRGPSACRPQVVEALRTALAKGREEIARRLAAAPSTGHDCAEAQAFLIDWSG
jgi:[protein-PII] uridylyltransferase